MSARLRAVWADRRGAAALLVVLGTTLVILLIAGTVAAQSRQELRMSRAETDARTVQMLVAGAFNEVAAAAWDPGFDGTDDGTVPCTPGPPYPSVCKQVLAKRNVPYGPAGSNLQIPVRVFWRVSATAETQVMYGWVLVLDGNLEDFPTSDYEVRGVRYYRHWCPPGLEAPYLGPCKLGG